MEMISTKTRIEYYATLVLCAVVLGIIRPELSSAVLLLMGALIPASFKVRLFIRKMTTPRYGISTVGLLYSMEKMTRRLANRLKRNFPRFLAPHIFSFVLALLFRLANQSGSLFYWVIGIFIFEICFNTNKFKALKQKY
jgi:small-conductance mechanosensitive channel